MKLTDTQQLVLESCQRPRTPEDLAGACDSRPGPMTRCANALVDRGYLRLVGTGYVRTAEGSKALKSSRN